MHTLRKGRNESFQCRQCKFHISTIKALLVAGALAPLFTLLSIIQLLKVLNLISKIEYVFSQLIIQHSVHLCVSHVTF